MNFVKPWLAPPEVVLLRKKKTRQPEDLISVCVTLYNYEAYIEGCLDSLKAQSHPNLDLIIVDDHSKKDDSLQVAKTWVEENHHRFYRAMVITHPRNLGPSFARNTAFLNAMSEFVFIIDADNEVYPRAISRLYAALQDGGFHATYSQLECFGESRKIGLSDIWNPSMILKENYVDVMSLVRKSAWEAVGGFSHIEEGWEDYDFWLKFIDAGMDVGYVPEILCRYRVHKNSRTHTDAYASHEGLRVLMAYRHPNACRD